MIRGGCGRRLCRIFGAALTAIPGISVLTAHTIMCEIGADIPKFRSAATFASWLGLCPPNTISGGMVLSVKTRRVKNRPAVAFCMAANALFVVPEPVVAGGIPSSHAREAFASIWVSGTSARGMPKRSTSSMAGIPAVGVEFVVSAIKRGHPLTP